MKKEQKSLVVDATLENLNKVISFVEKQLKAADCPAKIIRQISVSVEEIYVNVVNYAYGGTVGSCEITSRLEISNEENRFILTVSDRGKPFNPIEEAAPDITLPLQERRIGGLGIFMVKESMDEISYERISGCNVLTIIKNWK